MFAPLPNRRSLVSASALSVAAHVVAVGVIFFSLRLHPVKVFSLPGTDLGTRVELTYLPGRAPVPAPRPQIRVKPKARFRAATCTPTASDGCGAGCRPSPASATSYGYRSRSLPQCFLPRIGDCRTPAAAPTPSARARYRLLLPPTPPAPRPTFPALPHGVQGDVVVDVTIDPSGKVADLAVLHTLGYGIESSVIGTLKTWTFRPATKDGTPIASVQELHFHFGPV